MKQVTTPSILMFLADLIDEWYEPSGGEVSSYRPVNVERMQVFADPFIQDVYLVRVSAMRHYLVNLNDGESVDECKPDSWPPTVLGERI